MTALRDLGTRTLVMGIVNVTPDSFSGDGLATPGRDEAQIVAAATEQARRFVEDGADIIDVGAESTRPAAFYGDHPEVDEATELRLAIPVVEAIANELGGGVVVSIDTSKGPVARAALRAGARMVNDVWAGRRDPGTVDAAIETDAHLVLMHNKQVAEYPNGVMSEVMGWLSDSIDAAEARGLARERLLIDPGIGFGKTAAHSIEVLRRLSELRRLDRPILVGTSRKRFIGELLDGAGVDQRLEGTIASVVAAIGAGADVVRVHDVRVVVQAVRVADALLRHAARRRTS
jgi:dihydropteroate synthase